MKREEFAKRLFLKMTPREEKKVAAAYRISKKGHEGQFRDTGERYFEHPRRVALVLIDDLEIFDYEMIITALLHDIVEDTFFLTFDDIEALFGVRVRKMTEALTKYSTRENIATFEIIKEKGCCYLDDLQAADETTQIVKLADRLDNLRTLEGCSQQKKDKIIREMEEVYVPMAKKMENQHFYNQFIGLIAYLKK